MKFHLITVFLMLVCFSHGARGEDVIIYADQYTASHDILFDPISGTGGKLDGLDYTGEWVEYQFDISEFGTSNIEVALRGAADIDFHLEITVTADGIIDLQTIDLNFTGTGFG